MQILFKKKKIKLGNWCRIEGDENKVVILGIGVNVENEIAIRNCFVLPYRVITTSAYNEILIWFILLLDYKTFLF